MWDLLVDLAKKKETAFYEDIRDRIQQKFGIKYACQSIGFLLTPIQDHCMNTNLPPLTALIVNKGKGLPGIGFIAADLSVEQQFEEEKKKIFGYHWENEESPFLGYDTAESSVDSYADQLVKIPNSSKEVLRKVVDRGQCQLIFRQGLLKAYRKRCAVCGLSFENLLQAAHIKPWKKADDSEKISINNGILLCSNHHALYDKNLMQIKDDYTIDFDETKIFINTDTDRDVLLKYKGQKIALPKNEALWPSKDMLNSHET